MVLDRSALVSIVIFRTVTNINLPVFHVNVFSRCFSSFSAVYDCMELYSRKLIMFAVQ